MRRTCGYNSPVKPTRFELIVNIKTAKALGFGLPPTLIAGFSGAALTWPLVAHAQQAGRTYRIGVFGSATPVFEPAYRALLDELRKQGFVEGQNLVVDRRQSDQTPAILVGNVAEMVRSKVDAIVASGLATLQAAAGTGLPIIVSAHNFDPIAHGYVKSLAQPGGNVTGVGCGRPSWPKSRWNC